MEDTVSTGFKRCADGELYGFFGVFDGHGGATAAQYVRDNLFTNLQSSASFPSDMDAALKESFQGTDKAYLGLSQKKGEDDGCTGITAIVSGRQIWIAHVGDSRAILSPSAGPVRALSDDHKPGKSHEQRRIEEQGGAVIWAGTWRVSGVLAVSRAFGDRPLKKFVISLPDVYHMQVGDGEELVILASDGLWDVVTNKDAADTARKHKGKVQAAAKALADLAITRGSADNVSVIVIRFSGS